MRVIIDATPSTAAIPLNCVNTIIGGFNVDGQQQAGAVATPTYLQTRAWLVQIW